MHVVNFLLLHSKGLQVFLQLKETPMYFYLKAQGSLQN